MFSLLHLPDWMGSEQALPKVMLPSLNLSIQFSAREMKSNTFMPPVTEHKVITANGLKSDILHSLSTD